MPNADSLSRLQIAEAKAIDLLCDSFEEQWMSGARPAIREYCSASAVPPRPLFTELVRIDIEYRLIAGESPSLSDYSDFPEFDNAAADVAAMLESQSRSTDANAGDRRPPRYQIIKQIGEGAFGVVWKAFDSQLRRLVAIKQLRHTMSQADRKLWEREARAVARLDHPHVAKLLSIDENEGDRIIFEYVDGGSLKDWVERDASQPRDVRGAVDMVRQVASALHHVHMQGIVHRDIKPANILRTRSGTAKLVDFGLARCSDSVSLTSSAGGLVGTIGYMSPEQCRGESVGPATDVFSLGVVLYELLSGSRPYSGSPAELLARIPQGNPAPFPPLLEIPARLDSICRSAMHVDAESRPSACELESLLTDFVDERIPLRGPKSPRRRSAVSRRGFLRGLAALTACAALPVVGKLITARSGAQSADGFPSTLIRTDPPGAEIHVVQLDALTGEPIPHTFRTLAEHSPVAAELAPGEYRIVPTLKDGRFHEVLRHVPATGEAPVGQGNHERWTISEEGTIQLPTIVIPGHAVTANMARFDGSVAFAARAPGSPTDHNIDVQVAPFFLDRFEFTVREYERIMGGLPDDLRWVRPPSDDCPIALTWDLAAFLAELSGKRLMSEFEFEYAATQRGTVKYPWGNDPSPAWGGETAFRIAGQPAEDSFGDPAVFGLGSNVAEWTSTWANSRYGDTDGKSVAAIRGSIDLRTVRGGGAEVARGKLHSTGASRDPRVRFAVNRNTLRLGLGARFCRSARPPITPGDYRRAP